MVPVAISIFKAFLMVVPAICGLRVFFLSPETVVLWSGHRVRSRDFLRYRWLVRLAGLQFVALSLACTWLFLR